MNKISQFLYRLVLLPMPLYRSWGVNTTQLALILRYKLIIDDRRPNTFQQTRNRQRKEGISNAMLGTMLMALFMGLINLVAFAIGRDTLTHLTFFFTAFLFLLASLLITDFTSVLIDVKDNAILLPKPVNDRTILVAKLLHIGVHLSRVIIPISLPAVVLMAVESGAWAAVSLILLLVLGSLFAIFLINAVYLLVLRVMAPEKFKSFIAWFQVGFVIFIYGFYQIFLRLTDRSEMLDFSVAGNRLLAVYPPAWFAKAWLALNGLEGGSWIALAVCLLLSIGSILLVVRKLAPAFNRQLFLIQNSGGEKTGTTAATVSRSSWLVQLAGWVCGQGVARAGFLFTWRYTNRSRGFRMRVFPTIGYVAVWIILMFMPRQGEVSLNNRADHSGFSLILLVYMCAFIVISAIQQIGYSDDYKASWIFYSAPLEKPGALIQGGFLSMICKFYIPLAVLLTIGGVFWKGWSMLPNLLLGISNQLVICSLVLLASRKALPASRSLVLKDKSGNFLRGMLMLLITGATGMLHFLVFRFTLLAGLLLVLSGLANWLLIRKIGEINWTVIQAAD